MESKTQFVDFYCGDEQNGIEDKCRKQCAGCNGTSFVFPETQKQEHSDATTQECKRIREQTYTDAVAETYK